MFHESFTGKRVLILGLARQGVALARFFHRHGAQITISDIASADRLSDPLAELEGISAHNLRLVLGSHPLSLLDECDLLCISGGVPPQIPLVEAARRQSIPLSNDAILTIVGSPAPVIGITGSSGKTTTTTLVGLMLEAAGYRSGKGEGGSLKGEGRSWKEDPLVWVGGNIGLPLVDKLEQVRPEDWLVLELSSFQLELFDAGAGGSSVSPQIAVLLNITPNHLDRHPSMANYMACKANILRWQDAEDLAVLGADDAVTGAWLRSGQVRIPAGEGQEARSFPLAARRLGFGLAEASGDGCWLHEGWLMLRLDGQDRPVLPAGEIRLRGQHNLLNVMAACAAAGAAGVSPEAMAHVARTFAGAPHRLELVRELNGVRWINDSIATTPERAAAALRSYQEPIILLAGGRDKHLPWQEFAELARQRVRHLIVFGEAANLIADAVAQAGALLPVTYCSGLAQAVAEAARTAQPGDVILLSPGGTSYDAYKDFEARGRHFRELVNQL